MRLVVEREEGRVPFKEFKSAVLEKSMRKKKKKKKKKKIHERRKKRRGKGREKERGERKKYRVEKVFHPLKVESGRVPLRLL